MSTDFAALITEALKREGKSPPIVQFEQVRERSEDEEAATEAQPRLPS